MHGCIDKRVKNCFETKLFRTQDLQAQKIKTFLQKIISYDPEMQVPSEAARKSSEKGLFFMRHVLCTRAKGEYFKHS